MAEDTHLSDVHIKDEVAKFKSDVALVHKFAQGTKTEDVVTENGGYPTLAKLVEELRGEFGELLKINGAIIRKYVFSNTMTLMIDHTDINALVLDVKIFDVNGSPVLAGFRTTNNITYIDFTEEETGNVTVMFSIL